jgi:endonuclease/exonuclease/phosphatase family metal-dependent hydrolase
MLRRGLVAALVAATALACAAHNYLDPDGPLHQFPSVEARRLPDPAAPLRVVSFNIAYGIEIDRALEVLRGSEALRELDLLALQEMDAPGTERIAKALGINAVYFPSGVHPKHKRDFGCALLSPWPLVEPRKLLLPHGARGSGLRRAATVATVVRGAQRIRAYSVHLPSPLAVSGGSRRDELRVLASDAAASSDPVVIAGDFNSHDKVEELEHAGFAWLTRRLGDTTRFKLLGIPITGLAYDHVLTRGLALAPGTAALGIVADNHGASDHLPIWTLLVPDGSPPASGR